MTHHIPPNLDPKAFGAGISTLRTRCFLINGELCHTFTAAINALPTDEAAAIRDDLTQAQAALNRIYARAKNLGLKYGV